VNIFMGNSFFILTPVKVERMCKLARIYATGPSLGFFFGGFDFGFGEGLAVFAGGLCAQARGWLGARFSVGYEHRW
jgi:hypothetical protein